MATETLVYPDAVRGIVSLLRGQELIGKPLRPAVFLGIEAYQPGQTIPVHVEQETVTTGPVDRVQEVRLTVYGQTVLEALDVCEAILSYITGNGIQTPAIPADESTYEPGAAAFYFDSIRQLTGPSSIQYPDASVFPASAVVAARARPMTYL